LSNLDPTRTDTYPETIYAQTIETAEFDPKLADDPDRENHYEEFDTSEIDLSEDTYTAVGYWMMYVNDPKPVHTRGVDIESAAPFATFASHTGDASVIYIVQKRWW